MPTLVDEAPDGDAWFHEIKFDGYRMLCRADGSDVHFITRNDLDWTEKLPELAEAVAKLDLHETILDGEVVAFDDEGLTEFQLLQNAFRDRRRQNLVYMVFDLLFLDGKDLRDLPLEERKEKLAALGLPADRGPVRFVEHIEGNGPAFFEQASKRGLEGIVSKRRDRPYRSGRGMDWVKVKAHQRAEFVIGGFTDPEGARKGFGSLLVGYHDGDGKLRYAGRVGTGFSDKMLAELRSRLEALEQSTSPFAADSRAGANEGSALGAAGAGRGSGVQQLDRRTIAPAAVVPRLARRQTGHRGGERNAKAGTGRAFEQTGKAQGRYKGRPAASRTGAKQRRRRRSPWRQAGGEIVIQGRCGNNCRRRAADAS